MFKPNPLPDCMIDIETIDTGPESAVLSIAAMRWDANNKSAVRNSVEILIDVDDCLARGCTYSEDTIKWWDQQAPEVHHKAFTQGPRLSLPAALDELRKYVAGTQRFWCQGLNFDQIILEQAYKRCGEPRPWSYWQWRDSRTLMKLVDDLPAKDSRAHDAIYDVSYQIDCMFHVFDRYGIDTFK